MADFKWLLAAIDILLPWWGLLPEQVMPPLGALRAAGALGERCRAELSPCSRLASSGPKAKQTQSSLLAWKDVVTQTEIPRNHVAFQASGCSECQSLMVMLDDGCVRCQQVGDFLCMVAELREEVEWLRSIGESEEDLPRRTSILY